MKNLKKIFCLIITIMSVSLGFSQSQKEKDIQKGIEYHDKSRKEGKEYAKMSLELLEPYVDEDPYACAYYGSSLTVMAKYVAEKNPLKSLDYLKKGGEYLDKAVKRDPENSFIRLIHLENGIEVSRTSPVKRYQVIRKDVEWFLDDGNILKMEKREMAEAYLFCGYFKVDEGDLDYALELFENAVKACSESEAGKTAEKELEKYSE